MGDKMTIFFFANGAYFAIRWSFTPLILNWQVLLLEQPRQQQSALLVGRLDTIGACGASLS
jgi:hypothetical protein